MGLTQDFGGLIEPDDPAWLRADSATKKRYYDAAGMIVLDELAKQLGRGVGRNGRAMKVRIQAVLADGADGPVMEPHYSASRVITLADWSATDRGLKLWWHAGTGHRSHRKARAKGGKAIPFGEILGYHADGLVPHAPVRDVRLCHARIQNVRLKLRPVWQGLLKTGRFAPVAKPEKPPEPKPHPTPAPKAPSAPKAPVAPGWQPPVPDIPPIVRGNPNWTPPRGELLPPRPGGPIAPPPMPVPPGVPAAPPSRPGPLGKADTFTKKQVAKFTRPPTAPFRPKLPPKPPKPVVPKPPPPPQPAPMRLPTPPQPPQPPGAVPGPGVTIPKAVAYAQSLGIAIEPAGHAIISAKYGARTANIPAFYRPHDRTIYVNEQHVYWNDPADFMDKIHALGKSSTNHPDHVVFHETAHGLHHRLVGDVRYNRTRNIPLTAADKARIESDVSEYAAKNPNEFIAEVYTGLMAGRTFSPRVEKLYQSLGGPIPPQANPRPGP